MRTGRARHVASGSRHESLRQRHGREPHAARIGDYLDGLVLEDRGVLRSHQKVVVPGVGEGEMTSGTFSPTLERSIGFARVPAATGEQVQVDIRGKLLAARVVKYPFVRNGKALI